MSHITTILHAGLVKTFSADRRSSCDECQLERDGVCQLFGVTCSTPRPEVCNNAHADFHNWEAGNSSYDYSAEKKDVAEEPGAFPEGWFTRAAFERSSGLGKTAALAELAQCETNGLRGRALRYRKT